MDMAGKKTKPNVLDNAKKKAEHLFDSAEDRTDNLLAAHQNEAQAVNDKVEDLSKKLERAWDKIKNWIVNDHCGFKKKSVAEKYVGDPLKNLYKGGKEKAEDLATAAKRGQRDLGQDKQPKKKDTVKPIEKNVKDKAVEMGNAVKTEKSSTGTSAKTKQKRSEFTDKFTQNGTIPPRPTKGRGGKSAKGIF
jgi:hypothetical protein